MPTPPYFDKIRLTLFLANHTRKHPKNLFFTTIHKIVIFHMTISITCIIMASMIMLGFQKTIQKKFTTFSGDLCITKYTSKNNPMDNLIHPTQLDALYAHKPKQIKNIIPFIKKPMLIHTKTDIEGVICKGLAPQYTHQTLKDYLIEGHLPNLHNNAYSYQVCISTNLAKKLALTIHDSIIVSTLDSLPRQRKLTIVGLYCTYLNEFDDHIIFCDLRLLQRLNNTNQVTGYELFLHNHEQLTKSLQQTILHYLSHDFRLVRTDKSYRAFYNWLKTIQKNTHLFIFFILLIAEFTIVATMIIQIMERSYMIGVLKSLGTPYWQIASSMIYNNGRSFLKGLLYGNSLGLGLCYIQRHFKLLKLEPALYYMCDVPIYWNWSWILGLNILTLILACLTSALTFVSLKKTTILENFKC